MKVKELRIENWVNGNHNGFSKDVQVYEFNIESIRHTDKYQNSLFIDTFKPIELTEEWLLKFGFRKINGHNFLFPNDDKLRLWGFAWNVEVRISKVNYKWKLITKHKIKYVHQLQNLYFALIGEELEISNITQDNV